MGSKALSADDVRPALEKMKEQLIGVFAKSDSFHSFRYYFPTHCSFSRAGPTLWNVLPEDLRSTVCMNKFKTHLKTYYFKIAFNV